jgi:post-segregation antitoxin (ccd killing protein)
MVACHQFRYHDGMKRLQIQFTSAQTDRLREQARQRGVSIAALVREAVDAAFRDAALVPSQADRWKRSRAAIGRYGSGRPDPVSERHDEYLEEIYRS